MEGVLAFNSELTLHDEEGCCSLSVKLTLLTTAEGFVGDCLHDDKDNQQQLMPRTTDCIKGFVGDILTTRTTNNC